MYLKKLKSEVVIPCIASNSAPQLSALCGVTPVKMVSRPAIGDDMNVDRYNIVNSGLCECNENDPLTTVDYVVT